MKTLEEIKQTVKNLYSQIELEKAGLEASFEEGLKVLISETSADGVKYKIRIPLNNHAFNDGGPTRFSLYYDDLILYSKDVEIEGNYSRKDDVENEHLYIIRDKFVNFFKEYDIDNFYEDIYGNEYESLYLDSI